MRLLRPANCAGRLHEHITAAKAGVDY